MSFRNNKEEGHQDYLSTAALAVKSGKRSPELFRYLRRVGLIKKIDNKPMVLIILQNDDQIYY